MPMQALLESTYQSPLAVPKGKADVATPRILTTSKTSSDEERRRQCKHRTECHSNSSHSIRSALLECNRHGTRSRNLQKAPVLQNSGINSMETEVVGYHMSRASLKELYKSKRPRNSKLSKVAMPLKRLVQYSTGL